MNSFYQFWCEEMMKRIRSHLTRSFITEPNSKIPINYSFQTIEEKLRSGKYLTPFDWSIDLTNLIYLFIDGYEENSSPYLIAEDTLQWLNKKLNSIPKSEDDFNNKRIQKAKRLIKICMSGLSEKSKFREMHDDRPISSDDVERLQNMIQNINNPVLFDKVVHILNSYIGELNFDAEVVIDRRQISKRCFDEILKTIFSFSNDE